MEDEDYIPFECQQPGSHLRVYSGTPMDIEDEEDDVDALRIRPTPLNGDLSGDSENKTADRINFHQLLSSYLPTLPVSLSSSDYSLHEMNEKNEKETKSEMGTSRTSRRLAKGGDGGGGGGAWMASVEQEKHTLFSKISTAFQHVYAQKKTLLSLFREQVIPILNDVRASAATRQERKYFSEFESTLTQVGDRSLRFHYPQCVKEAEEPAAALSLLQEEWKDLVKQVRAFLHDTVPASTPTPLHTPTRSKHSFDPPLPSSSLSVHSPPTFSLVPSVTVDACAVPYCVPPSVEETVGTHAPAPPPAPGSRCVSPPLPLFSLSSSLPPYGTTPKRSTSFGAVPAAAVPSPSLQDPATAPVFPFPASSFATLSLSPLSGSTADVVDAYLDALSPAATNDVLRYEKEKGEAKEEEEKKKKKEEEEARDDEWENGEEAWMDFECLPEAAPPAPILPRPIPYPPLSAEWASPPGFPIGLPASTTTPSPGSFSVLLQRERRAEEAEEDHRGRTDSLVPTPLSLRPAHSGSPSAASHSLPAPSKRLSTTVPGEGGLLSAFSSASSFVLPSDYPSTGEHSRMVQSQRIQAAFSLLQSLELFERYHTIQTAVQETQHWLRWYRTDYPSWKERKQKKRRQRRRMRKERESRVPGAAKEDPYYHFPSVEAEDNETSSSSFLSEAVRHSTDYYKSSFDESCASHSFVQHTHRHSGSPSVSPASPPTSRSSSFSSYSSSSAGTTSTIVFSQCGTEQMAFPRCRTSPSFSSWNARGRSSSGGGEEECAWRRREHFPSREGKATTTTTTTSSLQVTSSFSAAWSMPFAFSYPSYTPPSAVKGGEGTTRVWQKEWHGGDRWADAPTAPLEAGDGGWRGEEGGPGGVPSVFPPKGQVACISNDSPTPYANPHVWSPSGGRAMRESDTPNRCEREDDTLLGLDPSHSAGRTWEGIPPATPRPTAVVEANSGGGPVSVLMPLPALLGDLEHPGSNSVSPSPSSSSFPEAFSGSRVPSVSLSAPEVAHGSHSFLSFASSLEMNENEEEEYQLTMWENERRSTAWEGLEEWGGDVVVEGEEKEEVDVGEGRREGLAAEKPFATPGMWGRLSHPDTTITKKKKRERHNRREEGDKRTTLPSPFPPQDPFWREKGDRTAWEASPSSTANTATTVCHSDKEAKRTPPRSRRASEANDEKKDEGLGPRLPIERWGEHVASSSHEQEWSDENEDFFDLGGIGWEKPEVGSVEMGGSTEEWWPCASPLLTLVHGSSCPPPPPLPLQSSVSSGSSVGEEERQITPFLPLSASTSSTDLTSPLLSLPHATPNTTSCIASAREPTRTRTLTAHPQPLSTLPRIVVEEFSTSLSSTKKEGSDAAFSSSPSFKGKIATPSDGEEGDWKTRAVNDRRWSPAACWVDSSTHPSSGYHDRVPKDASSERERRNEAEKFWSVKREEMWKKKRPSPAPFTFQNARHLQGTTSIHSDCSDSPSRSVTPPLPASFTSSSFFSPPPSTSFTSPLNAVLEGLAATPFPRLSMNVNLTQYFAQRQEVESLRLQRRLAVVLSANEELKKQKWM